MHKNILDQDALDYHQQDRPGKIEVVPTKPTHSQRDLSLAYSPGVAVPCLAIAENKSDVYKYTTKGNLVAVISNGTAVLGLGDIGPEASKPVMEGKGVLFKIFADIDVFDLELNTKDTTGKTDIDLFVNTVKALAPTFGGINLEDIKAPECFEIEKRLKAELDIPVMHDDQHGTAIISAAALLNALELQKKQIDTVQIVVCGAGAAAIACAKLYISLGAKLANILMCDSKGVISKSREGLSTDKLEFATARPLKTLADAMQNSDVFIGLSQKDQVNAEMLLSMSKNPIVFAMANPDPEINYNLALKTRPDCIMATGRSDYPNQVNNVLGFPYIFRGALDVRAKTINEPMKLAAAKAIAALAKKPIPESVLLAYKATSLQFGKDCIIPKPLDTRLLTEVAPAVAKAAISSGVADALITDWAAYDQDLRKRLGQEDGLLRSLSARAKTAPKKVVFPEADQYKILKAAQIAQDEGICQPILLGNKDTIQALAAKHGLNLSGMEIMSPQEEPAKHKQYALALYEKRQRKGKTLAEAHENMLRSDYFAAGLLQAGKADALITGLTCSYSKAIVPAIEVIGPKDSVSSGVQSMRSDEQALPVKGKLAGMYLLLCKQGPLFLADITMHADPSSEELMQIAWLAHAYVSRLGLKPRLALLSYANFGSSKGASPQKMRNACALLRKEHPTILIDGEMQANFALNPQLLQANFDFSALLDGDGAANVLIFPNLDAGNIAYKLLQQAAGIEAIGPILMGMNKPVHALQLDSSVREIVNMITLAVIDAKVES